MKRIASLTALMIGLLFPAGCRILEPRHDARPIWVQMPGRADGHPGFLTAVGAGFSQDPALAEEKARSNARIALAKTVTGYMENLTKGFLETHSDMLAGGEIGVRQFSRTLASEVSSYAMRAPMKEEVWGPDRNDMWYVLLSVPLPLINDTASSRAAELGPLHALFDTAVEQDAWIKFSDTLDEALKNRIAGADATEKDHPETADSTFPAPPQWLVTGRSELYPSSSYLLSTGLGRNALESENHAVRESLNHVAATGRTWADATANGRNTTPEAALRRQISELPRARLHSFPQGTVEVRIAKSWHDPDIDVHYALAVVERNAAARNCASAARKNIEDWRQRHLSGLNQKRAGNFREALEDLLLAAAAAESALQYCLTAFALQPPEQHDTNFCDALQELSLADTYIELNRLLGQFKIQPEQGPSQWSLTERTARRPLSVRVLAGPDRQPVGGVPVRFELLNLRGEFARSGTNHVTAASEQNGTVETEVRRIRDPDGIRGAVVRVSLATDDMLPGQRLYGELTPPSINLTYAADAQKEFVMSIRIEEIGPLNQAPIQAIIQKALAKHMEEAGYVLPDEEEMPIPASAVKEAAEADREDALQRLSTHIRRAPRQDKPVFLAIGTSRSDITARRESDLGMLVFSVCRLRVHLIKVDGDRIYSVSRLETEGFGASINEDAQALEEAALAAAEKMAAKILSTHR